MIIERLTITQDLAPPTKRELARLNAPSGFAINGLADDDLAEQLDELAPLNAELLVHDTFDSGTLDTDTWNTLGDVLLDQGSVQLGLPNDDLHIDTWKARPYLLTRRQFDPTDGELTILGNVTFAENFLHGYGGSFAVMTRADDSQGGGPGWENSILRRGVRSNFWPAAYGFDHSLEIHEKPAANTISLLVAQGFPIAPTSRTYLFKIVDNGDDAALTFIDAADPKTQKTVSHAIDSSKLRSGHIGFESCWGSPLRLDEVRIYRGNVVGD